MIRCLKKLHKSTDMFFCSILEGCARFEVCPAVMLKILAFWDITMCGEISEHIPFSK